MRPTEYPRAAHCSALQPALIALAIASCFAIQPAYALPAGAQVAAGTASLSKSGNTLTVANTPGTIINWSNFSVGALESVRFQQQSALSSVLNRVTGSESSAIQGALSSNGRVWLINPNGILFGAGSRIDIPGFVASTLNVNDSDFLAGKLNFNAGAVAGAIRNDGVISNAGAGNIYLVAPDITNTGLINAANGEVLLAAGRQVSLVDNAHPDVQIVVSAPTDQAMNLGQIATQNGRVSLFGALLSQKGRISADKVEVDDVGRIVFRGSQVTLDTGSVTTANGSGANGGQITIQSTGDTYVKGNVDATSSTGTGGTIQVLGNRVAVMDHATLDASGETGGGRILIGGDYQGKNPAIQNSQVTYFGQDAALKADAEKVGAGGTAIVWADDTTRAYGSISVRGGRQGGDGGFVEVSGKRYLDFQGHVDTQAPQGLSGSLLLDPNNITINSSGPDSFQGGSFSGGIFSGGTGNPTITWGTINGQTGAVTIRTSSVATSGLGDIDITESGSVIGPSTLTLLANRNLTIAPGATVSGGSADINLVAGWNNSGWAVTTGTGNILFGAPLSTSGKIWLNAGNSVSQSAGAIITATKLTIGNTNGGSLPGGVNLPAGNAVGTLAVQIDSATGSLTFSNAQALTIGAGDYSINGIVASGNPNPINITTTSGNLTVSQPIVSNVMGGAPINLSAANTLGVNAALTSTFNATPTGPVTLTAGTGGITSSSSGVITTGGLKVVSGGSVTLNAANVVGTLAGTSVGSFQFANSNGFNVDTVAGTTVLTASTGDITLKAGTQDAQIGINRPVTATAGNVTYIADNINVGAMTTSSATAGSYIKIRPLTASTAMNIKNVPDSAGQLNLAPSFELGNLTTPLLKFGDTSATGNLSIDNAIAPTTFSSLSLLTGGNISQTAGSTITITNLNADGYTGVTLTEANGVTNLGGHTNNGNFLFANGPNSLNIGLVDVNSGISVTTSGNIELTTGGAISQSAGSIVSAPAGTLTLNSETGIGGANPLKTRTGTLFLSNGTSGNVSVLNEIGMIASGNNSAPSGTIELRAYGPLTIDTDGLSSGAGITLTAGGPAWLAGKTGDNLSINGPMSLTSAGGGTITLNAGNAIAGSSVPVSSPPVTVVLHPNLNPSAFTSYTVSPQVASGSASHTYGQAPDIVFTYILSPTPTESIYGTAAYSPTISSLTSAGSFTVLYSGGLYGSITPASYFVTGPGLTYTVNPALLSLSLTGVAALSKIYDGNPLAGFTGGTLQGVINNDQVGFKLNGTFADRHVGTGKAVTLTGATLNGSGAANYIVSPLSGTYTADITPLTSVGWIGQPNGSGLWSDATNWTGGALPDRNNVQNVSIPSGAHVTYDSDSTQLLNLTSGGELIMSRGELAIAESLGTAQYSQIGGMLSGSGAFIASHAFSKTGGLFTMSGPVRVNQSLGNLLFTHDAPVRIVSIKAPLGTVTVVNTGATLITGDGVLARDNIDITAKSPLTLDGPLIGGGNVNLTASYPGQMTFTSAASINAPGSITLTATGGIVGTVPPGATVVDNIDQAPLPHGSLEQQLNCLLNPTTCNQAPSPESQQIIDSTLDQSGINQRQVIEDVSPETIKPVELLAGTGGGAGNPPSDPDDTGRSQQGSTGSTGSSQGNTPNTQLQYCN